MSPGPSEPMDAEEAARRDREIAELKRKGVDVMKREWFEGLMNPEEVSVNGCASRFGR